MSSSDWTTEFAQEGIFSTIQPDNPWYNANLVWVKYCSSDSWFGDAGPSNATFGFSFRGSRIITAAVTALMQHNGMGSEDGANFMLAGCSAGGRGVMAAVDTVAAMLPSTIKYRGMIDAAAWVDIPPPPWENGLLSLQEMTQDVYAFSNPPLGNCASVYTGGDAWKCLWASYRMPLIQTPIFINAAQFDAFQARFPLQPERGYAQPS